MNKTALRTATTRREQRELLKLSPFELKDKLLSLALQGEVESNAQILHVGRGKPELERLRPRLQSREQLGRRAHPRSNQAQGAGHRGHGTQPAEGPHPPNAWPDEDERSQAASGLLLRVLER